MCVLYQPFTIYTKVTDASYLGVIIVGKYMNKYLKCTFIYLQQYYNVLNK